MKKGALMMFALIFPLTIRACLPRTLKDQAIAALCGDPGFNDRTTCQQVEIVKVIEYKTGSGEQDASPQWIYCIELRFVDLTGESGIAAIWLVASSDNTSYEVYSGPHFESHCQ